MAEHPGLEGRECSINPEAPPPPEDVAEHVLIRVRDLLGVRRTSRRERDEPGLEGRTAHHIPEPDPFL